MSLNIAYFPKVGDFRFTRVLGADTLYTQQGGFYQFDQAPFIDSTMFWQTPHTYYQKRTFTDKCTVLVQTTAYGVAPEYPELSLVDAAGTIDVPLSLSGGPFVNGAQRITGNVYTNPISGATTQLDSFQWQFYFNMLLTVPTQNGLFYLRMRVYSNVAHTEYQDYISEPILVYEQFLGTTLIQAQNLTNRTSQGTIASGWNDGQPPTFQQRVEGFPVNYEPESVNVGYLQQIYLYLQQLAQSWRTWLFALGGVSSGVPAYIHEKVSELFLTDLWQIDGKYFALNNQGGDSVSKLWKTTDPTASTLRWATTPIRERFDGQEIFVIETPSPTITIVDFTADYPSAITPWALEADYMVTLFDPGVFDDNTERTAYLAYLNGVGLSGTFFFTGTILYYEPADGDAPALFGDPPEMLFDYFTPRFKDDVLGNECGFRYNEVGSGGGPTKLVIEWDDTTAIPQYSSSVSSTVVTHTFAGTVGIIRVFHNNVMSTLEFIEDGTIYPVTAPLYEVTGSLPTGLTGLDITLCDYFGQPGGGTSDIDISMCTSITTVSFRQNPELRDFSVLFDDPLPLLSNIFFIDNQINSATTDSLVNDFVANVWNGTLTPGTYYCTNDPAAPPTGASLAARDALTDPPFTFWTLAFDP